MTKRRKGILRVCLVGTGRMGSTRAKILYANPRVLLAYVVDANKEGEKLAELYGAKYTTNIADINPSDINALVICTGTLAHSSYIAYAAENGLHVFCEKPIDATPGRIESLFQLCKVKGVKLCCGFQRRFDKTYVAAKEAIESGQIGTPTFVRVFFADHPCPSLEFLRSGGDPFIDLAPHDVDFVRWCIGSEPDEIHAIGSSSMPELAKENILDTAMINIKFKNGCLCNIFMSRSSTYGYDQRCEIFGTSGKVSVENVPENMCLTAGPQGITSSRHQYSFPQRFKEAFESEMSVFVECILDGKEWPVSMSDCIAAQAISLAASKSCSLGTSVIYEKVH
mmetsp:Transcript_9277/g.10581  ORF Transcript_9277/g.10581 Transcript_9277/m.10581 type:complete len:338 (+) Transcript_9277:235-1248(+)